MSAPSQIISPHPAGRPALRGYYWREQNLIGNLGDGLAPILVRALGYELVSPHTADPAVVNPGKILLVIGSVLTVGQLSEFSDTIEVWGCGWKGQPLPAELSQRLIIHAVRGPQTVAGLGLPPDTPLGDPALLLPRLCPRPVTRHGTTVVAPHFSRTRSQSAKHRLQQSGCQVVLSTAVLQPQGIGRPGWLRGAVSLLRTWVGWGMRPRTIWNLVECIAGASFVLTGSLHGAILAQAYGVPWAAYDDGYIDAPAKWQDWAAYLGIDLEFVAHLADGRRWWTKYGHKGKVGDLASLLAAFPYPPI